MIGIVGSLYVVGMVATLIVAGIIWTEESEASDRRSAGIALYCWAWPVLLLVLLWRTKSWAFGGGK